MISFFLLDWFVARFLDVLVEADDVKDAGVPESMTLLGLLLIPVGVGALVWLATQSRWQKRLDAAEESEPLPPSTTLRPALYEAVAVRDRSQPPHRPRHRAHLVPAHPVRTEEATTVVIPSVDETVLLSKPSGRWGA